jgi:hypothetical protein
MLKDSKASYSAASFNNYNINGIKTQQYTKMFCRKGKRITSSASKG